MKFYFVLVQLKLAQHFHVKIFFFFFSGQMKRLEEHKVEQDKQLKAISKQMKVRFLSKNFSANALKVDKKASQWLNLSS